MLKWIGNVVAYLIGNIFFSLAVTGLYWFIHAVLGQNQMDFLLTWRDFYLVLMAISVFFWIIKPRGDDPFEGRNRY